jgi:ribosomal protein S18 acetylase RimI-like enzyme
MVESTDNDFLIRECHQGDAEAILSLWRHAEATVSITDTSDYIRRAIVESSVCFLVGEVDGRIVGSIIGTFDGWRGNVYRLAVHPKYQRRGHARALLTELEKRFAKQGVKRITALVEKDHPWAIGFWGAVDYELDSRMVRYVHNL